ncbi:MAG: PKD domain-containing protein [Thermoplasmata archaeon]|nr:PKD domain-containing protein [Thermoplasmata archaeon]
MAYDVRDGYLVLFGGVYSHLLNDTWKFEGGAWTNITNRLAPTGETLGAMTYDARDGYLLLYNTQAETWVFSNGSWATLATIGSPGLVTSAAIFYDVADRYVVMFGGYDSSYTALASTWTYATGVWTFRSLATHPSARSAAFAAYDVVQGYGILFSGVKGAGPGPPVSNDTWTYQNGMWFNVTHYQVNAPRAESHGLLAYDPSLGYSLLFSGDYFYNDTWWFVDPLTVTLNASRTALDVGHSLTLSTNTSGGAGPFAYTYVGLPTGCVAPNASLLACLPSAPGVYHVGVTVSGRVLLPQSNSISLNVNPSPKIVAAASRNATTVGFPVSFTSEVSGGTPPFTLAWTFGDSTAASGSPISHVFNAAGTFLVQLVGTDSDRGSSTANLSVLVHPGITPTIVVAANETDTSLPLKFDVTVSGGTSPFLFAWLFGDGQGASVAQTNHAFQIPGIFRSSVIVSDAVGGLGTAGVEITIHPGLVINATADASRVVQASPVGFHSVAVGGTGAHRFLWNFADGATSSASNPTHSFGATGAYSVVLNVSDAVGGHATTGVSVLVVAAPPTAVSPGSSPAPPTLLWILIGVVGLVEAFVAARLMTRKRRPQGAAAP